MSALEQIAQAKEFEEVPPPVEFAGFARRWVPPARYGEGHEDGFQTEAGVVLTTKRFRMRDECRENYRGTNRVVFLYHLDGQRTITTSTGSEYKLQKPAFVAYFQPKGIDMISCWHASHSETAVCLGFDLSDPPRIVADIADRLPALGDMLNGPGDTFKWVKSVLSLEMEKVARSILFNRVGQCVAHHYISAKCSELLCVTIDSISSDDSANRDHMYSMSDRMTLIKNLLEQDLQSKLSINDIAQEYDVPPRRVNKEFEEHYGINIQSYRTMVRLSKSVQLLLSSAMPLKKIAHEVGYDHASNFCIAFKKHYGHTPKEIRRNQFQGDEE